MNYEIDCAVACDKGKVRSINQDNFWCSGQYLEIKNNGLAGVKSAKVSAEANLAFAVFDGMGGEQDGEVAAHIAAHTFHNLYKDKRLPDIEEFLISSCKQMNRNITDYAKQKSAECVGTTAAMVMFGEKEIYACNVGDSRIYRYDGKNLIQISKDHVADIFKTRKPPLTQFLGIPENEFIIEPYIVREPYKDTDCYLICSDGLTDMLSDDEIKQIISQNDDVKICVDRLLENALSNGGRDNIAIILCKIKQIKNSGFKNLLKI